jgi:hypothetical protein
MGAEFDGRVAGVDSGQTEQGKLALSEVRI